jgi:hypothetical protein
MDIRIDIDNWHVKLPDLAELFPSIEFGNYYGRPYSEDYVKVDINKEYVDEWDTTSASIPKYAHKHEFLNASIDQ